jgi:hypothetical protein
MRDGSQLTSSQGKYIDWILPGRGSRPVGYCSEIGIVVVGIRTGFMLGIGWGSDVGAMPSGGSEHKRHERAI